MEKLVYTHLCHTGRWFNMHIRRTNVARKSNAVIRAPNSTQLNWFWNCSELNSTLWSSPLSAELSWALWSLLETPVPISDTDGVCASRLPTTMCNACARHRRRWRRQKTTSKKHETRRRPTTNSGFLLVPSSTAVVRHRLRSHAQRRTAACTAVRLSDARSSGWLFPVQHAMFYSCKRNPTDS